MTEKDIFEVVKYFKSIYTFINIKNEILLIGTNNNIKIYYTSDKFFIIHGILFNNSSNEFLKWIKNKNIVLNLSTISNLKECLKKNVISLNTDDQNFKLEYKNKDNVSETFICSVINDDKIPLDFKSSIAKINYVEKELGEELPINKSLFENEITEIYLTEGSNLNNTNTESENKIFELPSKRILSLLKSADNYSIKISGNDIDPEVKIEENSDTGIKQFIEISSSNDLIKLSQIFAII
jgi:hypothetical protein